MTDVKVTLTIKFSEEKEPITLTEEDARNLYNKLDNLFGTKWNYTPYYVPPEQPWIPYSSTGGTGNPIKDYKTSGSGN